MGGKLPTQTYGEIEKKRLDPEHFRRRLKLKHLETKRRLFEKHPKVHKFFQSKGFDPEKIRQHSAKIIGASAITGAMLFSPPIGSSVLPTPQEIIEKLRSEKELKLELNKPNLTDTFSGLLPQKPRPLERNEEKILEQVFAQVLGIPVKASLEGEHLNTTYGYIGAEQHLRRYPGDVLSEHGSGETIKEGLAPGLGAWGYFVNSKKEMTSQLSEIEKWYAVVQTLYLPDWNTRQPYLKNWYKWRKVLIVNTDNGKAVVAAIADSGPAAWTGKHYGGSPEVMDFLGGPKYKKGPVIVLFVDDPYNKVPLGPVEYN
jgi:hypothetical protein